MIQFVGELPPEEEKYITTVKQEIDMVQLPPLVASTDILYET